MVKINDPAKAEDVAQRLLQGRMDYVRRAIEARSALEDAQQAVREAEKEDSAAYNAAIKSGGWTEDELRKIGLNQPAKIKRVQQRKRSNGRQGSDKQKAEEGRTTQTVEDTESQGEANGKMSDIENQSG